MNTVTLDDFKAIGNVVFKKRPLPNFEVSLERSDFRTHDVRDWNLLTKAFNRLNSFIILDMLESDSGAIDLLYAKLYLNPENVKIKFTQLDQFGEVLCCNEFVTRLVSFGPADIYDSSEAAGIAQPVLHRLLFEIV